MIAAVQKVGQQRWPRSYFKPKISLTCWRVNFITQIRRLQTPGNSKKRKLPQISDRRPR